MGGKSAAILLPHADFGAAVAGIKDAAFLNNGSACIAHIRILVHEARYEQTAAEPADMVAQTVVGAPREPETFVGPLVSARQRERVVRYITLGVEEGARLVARGPTAPGGLDGGHCARATLFAEIDNSMRIQGLIKFRRDPGWCPGWRVSLFQPHVCAG
ncbi:aldehyde dehydrogenase family protein [Streptomyces sp. IB201691-2A2]|uniref:aldehyde dehydrogenase family protein n=1 Tax=Streptomyces sp. IB201691-2A2 TaxID=2561920 RepID=UPI00117FEC19|nr:aldehyde dehydrogenase family protein [Streptomyces sp. IB201691-2A2]TRO56034.1 aldehyde dehydrogenase family protein [Streptomyces sp. IB201691-2A2]